MNVRAAFTDLLLGLVPIVLLIWIVSTSPGAVFVKS